MRITQCFLLASVMVLTQGSRISQPGDVMLMSVDDVPRSSYGQPRPQTGSRSGDDIPRDVDSGCPCHGCLPSATYSLISPVPSSPGKVRWTTKLETRAKDDNFAYRGCVSDQTSVVCPTKRGYVSLDPMSGKVNWNYTTAAPPTLPILDIYGDAIGCDDKYMYYVSQGGQPQHPINISLTENPYSLMMTNQSQIFFASFTNITNQLIAYGTDGVCIASIPLEDTLSGVNGSFVVTAQPVISGARAYVLTSFLPDDMTIPAARKVLGLQRLYAADVHDRMVNILTLAWHLDLQQAGQAGGRQLEQALQRMKAQQSPVLSHARDASGGRSLKFSTEQHAGEARPILLYSRGVIYINNIGPDSVGGGLEMPTMSTLWAVYDNKTEAKVLYRQPCNYGPMATYDYTYSDAQKKDTEGKEDQIIWILTRSPGMVTGHSAANGSVVSSMWIADVAKMPTGAWLSSVLTVTRQSASSQEDVLLMGVVDASQEPSLLVVGAGLGGHSANQKPRLLWVTKIAAKKDGDTNFTIDGQIVNYVDGVNAPLSRDGVKSPQTIDENAIGLYAVVVEHGKDVDTAYVKGIF